MSGGEDRQTERADDTRTSLSSKIELEHVAYALLIVFGVVLIGAGIYLAGPETDTVTRYVAHEVHSDAGDLVLFDVHAEEIFRDGREVYLNVDDRIVCLPAQTWECELAEQRFEGETPPPSTTTGQFEAAYFDGEFYKTGKGSENAQNGYEPANTTEILDELAVDAESIPERERAVLEEGHTITTDPFSYDNRLIRYEDQYYTILWTAERTPTEHTVLCQTLTGDREEREEFCDRAQRYFWWQKYQPAGFGIFGLVGIAVGTRGLRAKFHDRPAS